MSGEVSARKKNEKRRAYDNGDYKKYRTRLSNYIGQQKLKLSDKVNAEKEVLDRFDMERKVYTKIMKDKVDEYQAENRLPDEDLNNFYKDLTNVKSSLCASLLRMLRVSCTQIRKKHFRLS